MCTPADRNASRNPLDEVAVPHPMSKRWIPYKHSNGIAIYCHQNVTPGHEYIGGEYMVSSIVKGTPAQCLAALTHRSSTTTILGPAAAVELLKAESNSQVLHLQLLLPLSSSLCSSWCAARHAVVRTVHKQEHSGIQCLMFSSLPASEAQKLLCEQQQRQRHHRHVHYHRHRQQRQQQWQRYSCTDQPQQQQQQPHHHHSQQQRPQGSGFLRHHLRSSLEFCTAAAVQACRKLDSWLASSSSSSSSSWRLGARLWNPVLVTVTGGYTISGLDCEHHEASPESLVTCILKVDLGGCLSEQWPCGWLYRAARALGIVDQLIEWLLAPVLLLKDEVEQQRFRSYPFPLLEDSVTEALGSSSAAAAPPPPPAAAQTANGLPRRSVSRTAEPSAAGGPNTDLQQQRQQQQRSSSGQQPKPLVLAFQSILASLSTLASWVSGFSSSYSSSTSSSSRRLFSSAQGQDSWSDLSFRVLETTENTPDVVGLSGRSDSGLKPAAVATAAAAADDDVDVGEDLREHLVGRDENGQPLRGFCNQAFWSELHCPGQPSIFQVRGPSYLADRAKVAAGQPAYTLLAVDLVTTPAAVQHLARFLPSVRRSRAASCFVVNMMVPETRHNVMNLVMTFGSTRHWKDLRKGAAAANGSSNSSSSGVLVDAGSSSSSSSGATDTCEWSGFDHVLYRFLHASDDERSSIFKMIPHIEVGSWVLKQMVGTTPVIMGRKLATTYHLTDKYIEVDIDVTTCKTAGYIVSSIRSVTTSMVVDLSYLLEGQRPCELPEVLLGAVRFSNIDMSATTPLDMSREIPMWPQPWTEQ